MEYTLTEEEINRLRDLLNEKNGHSAHYIKTEITENLLPNLFNVCEVGKYYCCIDKDVNYIIKCTDIEDGYVVGYGIDFSGGTMFFKDRDWFYIGSDVAVIETTKQDFLEEVKSYCIKKGFKEGVTAYWEDNDVTHYNMEGAIRTPYDNRDCVAIGNKLIFIDGEFAKIIEDIPSQEEIDRVLNHLKNK